MTNLSGNLLFRQQQQQQQQQQQEQQQQQLKCHIDLGEITQHNIKLYRRLNLVIFPVSYNEKFYKDALEAGELARLAYYNDLVVGGVCCRIETTDNVRRLYILTLGCLARYRRLGIGSRMLQHILNYAEREANIDNIYLHVQISNTGALEFYKRFGFEVIETEQDYYKRIEPSHAHVLQKQIKNKVARV